MKLAPFWRYYGGKWRSTPYYPAPAYDVIIEPFAGAAGYATRYADRKVFLCDLNPVIAEMWRYLIAVSADEVRRIPLVERVDDLPTWVPTGARYLIGFWLNAGTVHPCRVLSAGRRKMAARGCKFEGWTEATRARVAAQVDAIRHWIVLEASYFDLPTNGRATWFVDPPYNNRAGSYYTYADIDYEKLGAWCRSLGGQVIVCENEGSNWLPFQSLGSFKAGMGRTSREVIWCQYS